MKTDYPQHIKDEIKRQESMNLEQFLDEENEKVDKRIRQYTQLGEFIGYEIDGMPLVTFFKDHDTRLINKVLDEVSKAWCEAKAEIYKTREQEIIQELEASIRKETLEEVTQYARKEYLKIGVPAIAGDFLYEAIRNYALSKGITLK